MLKVKSNSVLEQVFYQADVLVKTSGWFKWMVYSIGMHMSLRAEINEFTVKVLNFGTVIIAGMQ